MAGKILGVKGWEFKLVGTTPPGVSDAQLQAWVLGSISLAVALMQSVKAAEVNVIDLAPPSGDGGPQLLRG